MVRLIHCMFADLDSGRSQARRMIYCTSALESICSCCKIWSLLTILSSSSSSRGYWIFLRARHSYASKKQQHDQTESTWSADCISPENKRLLLSVTDNNKMHGNLTSYFYGSPGVASLSNMPSGHIIIAVHLCTYIESRYTSSTTA